MSQRLNEMRWIWPLLVLHAGQTWTPASGAAVQQTPANKPTAIIESQAKYFQYRHLPTHEDFDQGHRLGSEHHFTERHERSRPSSGLYNAKVRWGDKKGGYGEHYWDLNHAGHSNDHDNDYDDGEYRPESYNDEEDSYDEPSEQSAQYEDETPREDTNYEETERKKRADTLKTKKLEEKTKQITREIYNDEDKPVKKQKRRSQENYNQREKNDIVLIVKQKDRGQRTVEPRLPQQFVASENVQEATTLSAPKLYLEPSTGRIIDRTTGQAYFLQPIPVQ